MKIIDTHFEGLKILEPNVFRDKRGYFTESFKSDIIRKSFGGISFIQDNESFSKNLVLRGLHFQKPPFAQNKLIRVTSGEILDVVVDLRQKSKTYGNVFKIILNEINMLQLFVPAGFAHGFLVKSKNARVLYKVDQKYNPDYEDGLMWNDKKLNINWESNTNNFKISKKDLNYNKFEKLISPF